MNGLIIKEGLTMKTLKILFNSGVEKYFDNITKFKECGDLKHYEFWYSDENDEEHHVAVSKDQIAMMDWTQDND
jgi:hypothetical protein